MTQFWKVIDVILSSINKEKDLYKMLLKLMVKDDDDDKVRIVGCGVDTFIRLTVLSIEVIILLIFWLIENNDILL